MSDRDSSGAYGESAEALFDHAPVGYLSILGDGRIVRVNQTLLKWTGHDRDTFLASRFAALLTVPGRLYYETSVSPALQMRGSVREVALDLSCVGRAALPVLMNFTLIRAREGAEPIIRASVFDATERRQYERDLVAARRAAEQAVQVEQTAREAAESASRVKDDFLAMISHELRAPLAAILGWTTLLRRTQMPDQKLTQGLDVIERNARVQVQLVEDLLDVSRMVSGKLRLQVQRVELNAVVEAALETTRFSAEAKGIRLLRERSPDVFVTGDPARLQQIFWNLLSNAVKFTPRNGSIRIATTPAPPLVGVSVSDSGQGMSADFIAKAFERFRQADSAIGRASSGLGLGLSIVKQLAEMHGGSVDARSDGLGHGSTFTVTLPVATVETGSVATPPAIAAAVTPGPVTPTVASLRGLRVLIAEDQGDSREVLRRVLAEAGACVIAVENGTEALAAIAADRPHILISDIGLPDLDGYELIRRTRMTGEGSGLPAIALTAFARAEDRTLALMAGFQLHLSKPIDARELILAVAGLVGRLGPGCGRTAKGPDVPGLYSIEGASKTLT